jgi:hypothetical protein
MATRFCEAIAILNISFNGIFNIGQGMPINLIAPPGDAKANGNTEQNGNLHANGNPIKPKHDLFITHLLAPV